MNSKRIQTEAALAKYYSNKFNGKVWCLWDTEKRAYCIRGEGLPSHPDLREQYPNGWSLLDYVKPTKAAKLLGEPVKPSGKRILSVTVKRMVDESPDTSYLGEYSNTATSEFSIDRAHSEDCSSQEYNHSSAANQLQRIISHLDSWRYQAGGDPENTEWEALDEALDTCFHLQDEVAECDCNGGSYRRGEFPYFNPSFNYVDSAGKPKDLTPEEVRKYTRQDYERMERLNAGDWCYIGIRAEAEIAVDPGAEIRGGLLTQTITSGGLFGTESDSNKEYLASVAAEELADLKGQLLALGFSKRAISQAFKPENIKERDA